MISHLSSVSDFPFTRRIGVLSRAIALKEQGNPLASQRKQLASDVTPWKHRVFCFRQYSHALEALPLSGGICFMSDKSINGKHLKTNYELQFGADALVPEQMQMWR
jgi:hypothetical protein